MADDGPVKLTPITDTVSLPPPVTEAEVRESKHEQALAPIKGLLVSAAAVVPGLVNIYNEGWLGTITRGVSKYGGGVHYETTPKGRFPVMGKASGALFLLPAPIGIVPPELMQIRPSFLHEEIGRDIPGQEFMGVRVSSVRERVFESERAERAIIHAVLKDYSIRGTPQDLSRFTTPQLVAFENFLKTTSTTQARSPLALRAITAELDKRPNLSLPVDGGILVLPSPTAIPQGGVPPDLPRLPPGGQLPAPSDFNPNSVRAIRLAAMAVLTARDFLRRELLSERADP